MSENLPLDPIVLSAFKNGDHAAFQTVFDTFYHKLCHFVNRLVDNKEETEDIVLPSFLKLFENCSLLETEATIQAFLYATARNKSIDFLRYNKRQKEKQQAFIDAMKDDTLFEYEYEIKDKLMEMVRAAIEELPEECKRIFKMLVYDELSPGEVAEILQISVSTVYNQKSLALKALRVSLKDSALVLGLVFLAAYMKDIFSLSGTSHAI